MGGAHHELHVNILEASDLSLPRSGRLTRVLSGPDQLHAELQVGLQRQKTREIEIPPGVQSAEFSDERMVFNCATDRALCVSVKSGTILCGHPCIGKATLPLGEDLYDTKKRLLQIHLECDGNIAGKILIEYCMLPML